MTFKSIWEYKNKKWHGMSCNSPRTFSALNPLVAFYFYVLHGAGNSVSKGLETHLLITAVLCAARWALDTVVTHTQENGAISSLSVLQPLQWIRGVWAVLECKSYQRCSEECYCKYTPRNGKIQKCLFSFLVLCWRMISSQGCWNAVSC